MPEPLSVAPFLIADWTVDPRANEISRGGVTHRLEPKVMDVLVVLAERAGRPVTREELLELVWPGVFVSESALSRCVSQLRKLFDDDPREPAVIETLAKVGYRLVARPRPAVSGDSISDGTAAPRVSDVVLSVAGPSSVASPRRPALRWWHVAVAAAAALASAGVLASSLGDRTRAIATVVPLTTTHRPETGAAPSPDGSRVAFVGSSAEEGNQDIYVQVLGDGSALRLTTNAALDLGPAWSPDGRRIAFVRCTQVGECEIRTVSALGGEERRLFTGAVVGAAGLSWHPDGSRIAFGMWESSPRAHTAVEPRRSAIWVMEVATGRATRLTEAGAGIRGDSQPRYSRDGRLIAFRREAGPGIADVFVVPSAGGDERRLTSDARFLAGHAWLDDRNLVLSSDRNGLFQLWRVSVGSGDISLIESVPTRDPGGPVVTPDGQLVFEEWEFETDVWRAESGASPRALVTSTWRDLQPHQASDGRVAFASDRSGTWEIWTARSDGSGAVRVTSFDGPSAMHPRWSPDGRRLAFEVRHAGRASVYVVDAEGGRPRRISPTEMDAVVPRWSLDGQALFVSARSAERWESWRIPLRGSPERITVAGGYGLQEIAGGRFAYAKYGMPGLYVRNIAGGPERLLSDRLSPVDATNWWPEERAIILPVRSQAGIRLARLDVETGALEEVATTLERLAGGEGTISSALDGSVLYTRTMRVEADLVLAEPFDGR